MVKKTLDKLDNNSISGNSMINDVPTDSVNEEKKSPRLAIDPKLFAKYPTRDLEELRKIDYIMQYQAKLPEIKRDGYKVSWICNTPFKNYIDHAYNMGYSFIPDVEPVASGWEGSDGENMHYAMQIPLEIAEKHEKAKLAMDYKMYGHILKPDSKGNEFGFKGDGMYDPSGRKVETVKKIIETKET